MDWMVLTSSQDCIMVFCPIIDAGEFTMPRCNDFLDCFNSGFMKSSSYSTSCWYGGSQTCVQLNSVGPIAEETIDRSVRVSESQNVRGQTENWPGTFRPWQPFRPELCLSVSCPSCRTSPKQRSSTSKDLPERLRFVTKRFSQVTVEDCSTKNGSYRAFPVVPVYFLWYYITQKAAMVFSTVHLSRRHDKRHKSFPCLTGPTWRRMSSPWHLDGQNAQLLLWHATLRGASSSHGDLFRSMLLKKVYVIPIQASPCTGHSSGS